MENHWDKHALTCKGYVIDKLIFRGIPIQQNTGLVFFSNLI